MNTKAKSRPPESWILEGIMTTVAAGPANTGLEGRLNIAPMGPIVDREFTRFVFRPFKTSTTYQNLKARGAGVFHVTDDVLLLARAALGKIVPDGSIPLRPARTIEGLVLTDACRYYELTVVEFDDRDERTRIVAEVLARECLRDFFGFNRARHAIVEASILATRLFLTGREPVLQEFERLQVIVDKTGGDREQQAMTELRRYAEAFRDAPDPT